MPLGVVITGANANDGCQAKDVLQSLVVRPEPPERPAAAPDERSLPTSITDGAYNNRPTRQRVREGGFRLQAPRRGQKQHGLGKVRNAVERCHNCLAQFGRIGRRLDRSAKTYLGWVQLAACVIFIRSGFVP
jgi:transposase